MKKVASKLICDTDINLKLRGKNVSATEKKRNDINQLNFPHYFSPQTAVVSGK